jgi:hypothetical protein
MFLLMCVLVAGCTGQDNQSAPLAGNQTQSVANQGSQNQQNQNTDPSAHQQAISNSLPGCPDSGVFTLPPVSSDSFYRIMPLGNLNPPSHTIPTDHIYFVLNTMNNLPVETTVYAPSDIAIYGIKYSSYENKGATYEDYAIEFSPCKELHGFFGHVEISNDLKKQIVNMSSIEFQGPPGSKQYYYLLNYTVKRGDIIATVGSAKSQSASLDLGIYDDRLSLGFINKQRFRQEYLQTACPLDYFAEPLKTQLMGELKGNNGQRRTKEPICGTNMQDVPGTAQGDWFNAPTAEGNVENSGKAASLVHDFGLGIDGKLVVGGEVAGPGIITFNPTHSGTINREPSEVVADGKIYCYQNDMTSGMYMPLEGKVIVQLVDANTLKIEHKNGSCTGSETFANPYTYQR